MWEDLAKLDFHFYACDKVLYLGLLVSNGCTDFTLWLLLLFECYVIKQVLEAVSQELLDTQKNPAIWEISRHIVLKRRKNFEDASETYTCRILAEISLSKKRFEEVKANILEATCFQEVDTEENNRNHEENHL